MKESENAQEKNGKKQVTCMSCEQEVEVKLIEYGKGYIATCPECKKLAYNSK